MDCPNTRTILIFNSLFAVVSIVAQRSYCQIDESRHAKSKTAGVVLTVTDEQGDAINDADVSVMEWTGTYQPYLSSPVVYREGRFYLDCLDIEKMLYLKVNADGFAPSIQSLLSLTEGESRAITFKLSRPATGCIYVVDPEGKPVSGATISSLLYHDVNKNEVYVTAMTSDSLSFSFAESDASGVLKLPPLPKYCKATITVFHHDWLIGKAMDAVIIDGLMCSVILEPGVRVECHLKQRAGDDQNLEGKLVNVKMYSNSRSQIQPTNFIAAVPIARNRIVFTANPVEYNQLILELDSHVLGQIF